MLIYIVLAYRILSYNVFVSNSRAEQPIARNNSGKITTKNLLTEKSSTRLLQTLVVIVDSHGCVQFKRENRISTKYMYISMSH